MKLTNFNYRKPEERKTGRERKPAPPAGVYQAKIYNVSEWTNKDGKTALYVNVDLGEYEFGIKFDLYHEKENRREYAEYAFSSLLDACGIDGATFNDTDILVGKILTITIENGNYGLQATKFEPPTPELDRQNFDYNARPNFMNDNAEQADDLPF